MLVDLFEARFLATEMNDQDLFQDRLSHVISADPEALKDASLINKFSQPKVKYYLKHQGDFFQAAKGKRLQSGRTIAVNGGVVLSG